jgi:hypothetical protein
MSSDEVLEYFVKGVEDTAIGFNIQLCLRCVVITGSLIRSKQYYDMMSSTFDHAEENVVNDKAESESWHEYIEHYKQSMKKMRKQNEVNDSPKYIHLQNVVMYPTQSSSTAVTAECWLASYHL